MLEKPLYRCNLDLIRQNFPEELRTMTLWCNWRYQWREPKSGKPGKWTKVPYQSCGLPARSNDRATWSSFDSVADAMAIRGHRFDGVGCFLFPPLVGVDFDKVRNPETGVIEPWAADIISGLSSYTEVSPSGSGLHVWTTGQLSEEARNRSGQIEIYAQGRYFTVTGWKI